MTEAQRHQVSRVLFVLALPVCFAFLIFGWDNGLWHLAKPAGLAVAGLAWWIAPKKKEES